MKINWASLHWILRKRASSVFPQGQLSGKMESFRKIMAVIFHAHIEEPIYEIFFSDPFFFCARKFKQEIYVARSSYIYTFNLLDVVDEKIKFYDWIFFLLLLLKKSDFTDLMKRNNFPRLLLQILGILEILQRNCWRKP